MSNSGKRSQRLLGDAAEVEQKSFQIAARQGDMLSYLNKMQCVIFVIYRLSASLEIKSIEK
jgi:hypothetical protein